MPETRRRAREQEASDIDVTAGTHKARVLSLLGMHEDVGYSPAEIASETGVPRQSLGKVLQRLRNDELVVKHGDYYFVAEGRYEDVKRLLFDDMQLAAATQISDRNTAPEELDYTPTDDLDTELLDDIED